MLTPQRRLAAGVMEELLQSPQQFSFFQAVRLLDRWLADGDRLELVVAVVKLQQARKTLSG